LFRVDVFEISDVLLKTYDLRPQAVAFVGELSDALTQPVVVGVHCRGVGGIDEAGVAITLSGAVRAHPLRVRRPLSGSAHSPRTGHRIEMVGA
jgi:hypothetical protein